MKRFLPLLIVAAGCDGPGPTPVLDQIQRALVCNVPGAGFDLAGDHLQKAQVELLRTETQVGVAVDEAAISPSLSHSGGSVLHVMLDGSNALPGAYDVTAIAGGGRWTVPHGLGLLSPPKVTQETPVGLCNAQSQQVLTIHGNSFVVVQGVTPTVSIRDVQGVEKLSAAGTPSECVAALASVIDGIQICNALSVELPMSQLKAGIYVAIVQDPAPFSCSSSEMIPFSVEPPPSIDITKTSASLCQGGGTVDIKGAGFVDGTTVTLGSNTPAATTLVSDGEITARFDYSPDLVARQQLTLALQNPDGCDTSASAAVTITPGPVLLSVEPPFAHHALRTPITLNLSSLTAPGMITLTAQQTGVPVTLTTTPDPQHLTRGHGVVPPGLPVGVYDVSFSDGSGCDTSIKGALTVVTDGRLTLQAARPQFGDRSVEHRIAITAMQGSAILPGARAYLAPTDSGGSPVIPLAAVLEADALHALVPAGIDAARYGVLVINPDGNAAILDVNRAFGNYQAIDGTPPAISRMAPDSLEPGCVGCQITLEGSGFGASPSVGATCYSPGSAQALGSAPAFPIVSPSPSPAALVVDGSALAAMPHGTQCSLYVTNTDGTVQPLGEADRPVVAAVGLSPLVSSQTTFPAGPSLNTTRRAPATVVGQAEPGSRFLYALGGDGGTLTSARPDGEFAPLGPAGIIGPFVTLSRAPLPTVTSLAGAAAAGRWIFLVGGNDGGESLWRVARAEVLNPAEAPRIDDAGVELDFQQDGLASGTYYYRVAARFTLGDAINPVGESLASTPVAVTLAPLAQRFDITIHWSAGATDGRAIAGWRIYRGTKPDQLDSYIEVPADVSTFKDNGTMATASQEPLALGALGHFVSDGIPQLNTPRAGAGVTVVPGDVAGRYFLYAGFGWDSTSSPALPVTYEVLQIDASDGGTDFGVATRFTERALGSTGRWLIGGFAAAPEHDARLATRVVYFGQGTKNLSLTNLSSGDNVLEMSGGTVGSDGALTPISSLPTATAAYGYASFSGGDALTMVGGADTMDQPLATPWRATFGDSTPTPDAWSQTSPLLPNAHFLPGAASDGPYLFVVGGSTAGNQGTASTEVSFGLY